MHAGRAVLAVVPRKLPSNRVLPSHIDDCSAKQLPMWGSPMLSLVLSVLSLAVPFRGLQHHHFSGSRHLKMTVMALGRQSKTSAVHGYMASIGAATLQACASAERSLPVAAAFKVRAH